MNILKHNINFAMLYFKEQNLEKAFDWYQKAVENGNFKERYCLATLYRNGEETKIFKKSILLISKNSS